MTDYINIGSTPIEESCAQVGSDNYAKLSRIEGVAFKHQCERVLKKEFGDNLEISVRPKSFPHDFGTYHEVVAFFNPDNPTQVEQAFWLEANTPEEWDDQAIRELERGGYNLHKTA